MLTGIRGSVRRFVSHISSPQPGQLPRSTKLEQDLSTIGSIYTRKTPPAFLTPKYKQQVEAAFDQGKIASYFHAEPMLINTVMQTAQLAAGSDRPIIIDMGGGACPTHRAFAKAGAISVCVDPDSFVLAKLAQKLGMTRLSAGVYKDRVLDHYLVVGDAQTAAKVMGIDNAHPLLAQLNRKKEALLREYKSLAQAFDPEKINLPIDDYQSRLLNKLAVFRSYLDRLNIGQEDAVIKEIQLDIRLDSMDRPYPPFTAENVRQSLNGHYRGLNEVIISYKGFAYLQQISGRAEQLRAALQQLDQQIEQGRLGFLTSAASSTADLVFCGYMNNGLNLTPEIKSLLPKAIIYVTSGDCVGVDKYRNLHDLKLMADGIYDYSHEPGVSYTPIAELELSPYQGYLTTYYNEVWVQQRRDLGSKHHGRPAAFLPTKSY